MNIQNAIYFPVLSIIFLFNNSLIAQNTYEDHHVWNADSTNIYLFPNTESEIIARLPYGSSVVILEELVSQKTRMILEPNEFIDETTVPWGPESFWLKIIYQDIIGYALNAEIINFPAMKNLKFSYDIDLEKIEKAFDLVLKDTTYMISSNTSEEFQVKVRKIYLPDGSELSFETSNGCTNRMLLLRDKTVLQAYQILKTWHSNYTSAKQFQYKGITDDLVLFETSENSFYRRPYIKPISPNVNIIGSYQCDN